MAEDAEESAGFGASSDGVPLAVDTPGIGGDVVSSPTNAESKSSPEDDKTILVRGQNATSSHMFSPQRDPFEADQKVQTSEDVDDGHSQETNSTTSSRRSSRQHQPNEGDQKVQTAEPDNISEESSPDDATLSNEAEVADPATEKAAPDRPQHAIPLTNEENFPNDTATLGASAPVMVNADGVADEVGPTIIDNIVFGVQAPFQERLVLDILWYSWIASFAPQTIGRVCKLIMSQSDIASVHKLFRGAISLGSRIGAAGIFALEAIVCCALFLLIGTFLTYVYLRNPSDFGRKVKNFIESSNSSAINSTGFNSASDTETLFNDTALLHDTEFNDTAFNGSLANNTTTLGDTDGEDSSWKYWINIILSKPMMICFFGPLIEEVTFRLVLPVLMQRCFNFLRRQHQNQSGSINKSIVSICSFFFAVSHLPKFDLTKERQQSSAMYRFVYTMLGAEWILAPTYEERGFVAAWAAHGSFNVLVSFAGWFKKNAKK